MSVRSFQNSEQEPAGSNVVRKGLTGVRVFFIGAMIASGVVELLPASALAEPILPLIAGAIVGAVSLAAVKFAHLI